MAIELRYNTAGQEVPLGYFLDSSDGDTEETGLTIANTDIKLWKWGATTLASKNSGGATHISNGIYYAVFDATDTNTPGPMKVFVHVSGSLAFEVELNVVSQQYWDAKYGSGYFSANTVQIEGSDATDQIRDAIVDDATRINASQLNTHTAITASAIVDEWETQSQADPTGFQVNVKEINGTAQTANDNGADINTLLTRVPDTISLANINAECDTALTDYDAPTKTEMDSAFTEIKGATWDSSTDTLEHIRDKETDIEADTAEIGTAGAGLSAIPWNAAWDAEVQSEVQDAIEANHLDHLLAVTYDPASKPGAADALLNELVENDGGVSRFTENALEQAPSGTGASAATIADAVWDEAQADHVAAGSFGEIATEIATIESDVGALNDISVADILAGVIEGSLSLKSVLRLVLAFVSGKTSGGGTTQISIRDLADSKDRIVMTVDSNGNRSAVTTDAT